MYPDSSKFDMLQESPQQYFKIYNYFIVLLTQY